MTKRKYTKVICSKCKQPAFYLPSKYDMNIPILCIACGSGKKRTVKTAAARYANIKRGKREDLGDDFFRSPTEANFARALVSLKIPYEFEKRVFTFANYERKPFQYIPDFKILPHKSKSAWGKQFTPGWYEIKGWMNSESRSKLKRFRICYPEEAKKMTVVVYARSDRAAAEFCKKEGFRVLYWDVIRKDFEVKIPTWE